MFERQVLERFTDEVRGRFPQKSFGYFVAEREGGPVVDYFLMRDNHRQDWLDDFGVSDQYYTDNATAGFLASPEETWRVERAIRDSGLRKVGVFHSHQRHPAILAKIDVEFHPAPDLWHLLIALRNLDYPLVRAFDVSGGRACERGIDVVDTVGAQVGTQNGVRS